MMTISKPIDNAHSKFQEDVINYLRNEKGYLVEPGVPYHSLCPNLECLRPVVSEETKSVIRQIYDNITVHYFRDTNDLFAIHPETQNAFFMELKTKATSYHGDITMEAIQFLFNWIRAKLTPVKIIYAFRNPFDGEEKGFILGEDMPRQLRDDGWITVEYHEEQTDSNHRPIFEEVFEKIFGGRINFSLTNTWGKSYDPYIWIRKHWLDNCLDWRELV